MKFFNIKFLRRSMVCLCHSACKRRLRTSWLKGTAVFVAIISSMKYGVRQFERCWSAEQNCKTVMIGKVHCGCDSGRNFHRLSALKAVIVVFTVFAKRRHHTVYGTERRRCLVALIQGGVEVPRSLSSKSTPEEVKKQQKLWKLTSYYHFVHVQCKFRQYLNCNSNN